MNKLWYFGLKALPTFFCCLAILGQYANLFVIGGQSILMVFVYTGIFFAATFKDSFLPASCVFLLGLLADALQSQYFGLNAFSFLLFYFITVLSASFLKELDFIGLWISFVVINLCCCVGVLGLTFFMTGKGYNILTLGTGLLLNGICYPLVLIFCHKLNQLMGVEDDSVEV